MEARMTKQDKNRGRKVSILKGILLLVAVLLLGMIAARVFPWPRASTYDPQVSKERCLGTKAELARIRSALKDYHQSNHRYPNSLAELRSYVQKNPEKGIMLTDLKEHITTEEGNGREGVALDGTGGWYYDKGTGNVKLNITKPVKYYLGPTLNAEDIPAEW